MANRFTRRIAGGILAATLAAGGTNAQIRQPIAQAAGNTDGAGNDMAEIANLLDDIALHIYKNQPVPDELPLSVIDTVTDSLKAKHNGADPLPGSSVMVEILARNNPDDPKEKGQTYTFVVLPAKHGMVVFTGSKEDVLEQGYVNVKSKRYLELGKTAPKPGADKELARTAALYLAVESYQIQQAVEEEKYRRTHHVPANKPNGRG